MSNLVIGLSGRKQSGKDTFAERLVLAHGFTRVAFADPMRAAALALDPLIPVNGGMARLSDLVAAHGWDHAKEAHFEVRRTLQRLGTEMGRELFGEGFWVSQAMEVIDRTPGPVVVTDVRFPNEADAIFGDAGVVIRIERPGLPATDLHPSETALEHHAAQWAMRFPVPFWSAVVVNNGSVEDLHQKADTLIAGLVAGRRALGVTPPSS